MSVKLTDRIPEPVIISVPYELLDDQMISQAIANRMTGKNATKSQRLSGKRNHSAPIENELSKYIAREAHLIDGYPTVYIIHAHRGTHDQRIVYVGETNNIEHRTWQHLNADPRTREDWKDFSDQIRDWNQKTQGLSEFEVNAKGLHHPVNQYIIGDRLFNKSLTLDIENELMGRLLAVPSVTRLNNRRKNPQSDYYTHEDLDRLFTKIWLGLNKQDHNLFPSEEVIRQSALFKASPFHALTAEQKQAEEQILDAIHAVESRQTQPGISTLILVSGIAGTGKTVLLSDLFYRLSTEGVSPNIPEEDSDAADDDSESESLPAASKSKVKKGSPHHPRVFFVVNHNEQTYVYNEIATKLGIQSQNGEYVRKPASLIYHMKEKDPHSNADLPWKKPPKKQDASKPADILPSADVILVDEAHLLLTEGSQGYPGYYRRNMLYDLLARARVVVAVFDPNQLLEAAQHIPDDEYHALFPAQEEKNAPLERQQRGSSKPVRLPHFDDHLVHLMHLHLTTQMRIAADRKTLAWLDNFIGTVRTRTLPNGFITTAAEGRIGEIPVDTYGSDTSNANSDENGKLPSDSPATLENAKPYDIRVYESPVDLFRAIKRKAQEKADGLDGHGITRVIATYDWPYKDNSKNPADQSGFWTVSMHRMDGRWVKGLPDGYPGYGVDGSEIRNRDDVFCQPWNYQIKKRDEKVSWAERPETIDEVGSTYTIQGFDLNYAGVILGLSIGYEGTYPNGRVVFRPDESSDRNAVSKRDGRNDYAQENLRNQLNVLLKRGVHGLYLFALDPALEEALRQAALPHNKWVPSGHEAASDSAKAEGPESRAGK